MSRMSDLHAETAADRADDAEREASRLRDELARVTAERDALRDRLAGVAEDESGDFCPAFEGDQTDGRDDDEWLVDSPAGFPGDPTDYPKD